jgi:hypothetical protein
VRGPEESSGGCCETVKGHAPEHAASRHIKPFLYDEGIFLDNVPGSLGNFLIHYRDSFLQWIEPHVPRSAADALLGLYNQVLEQLEVELDAVKECLEDRSAQEMKWVKMILSLKERITSMEEHSNQKAADLDALRSEVDQLKEGYDAKRSKTVRRRGLIMPRVTWRRPRLVSSFLRRIWMLPRSEIRKMRTSILIYGGRYVS